MYYVMYKPLSLCIKLHLYILQDHHFFVTLTFKV